MKYIRTIKIQGLELDVHFEYAENHFKINKMIFNNGAEPSDSFRSSKAIQKRIREKVLDLNY